jgi:hypothetical protein
MSAPDFLTWEGNGDDEDPRRPSTDDLGGDEKEDEADFPPDDVEHFTAGGWNQKVMQIAAMARVAAACKIKVEFSGGTPAITDVTSPSSSVTAATFTVTDEGTGVTLIEWPANTFPPHACAPTGLTPFSADATAKTAHAEEVTDGVRVRTFAVSTAADVDFSICIN